MAKTMPFVRTLIRDHFALLLPLMLLALFVRALVPQGYMPASGDERLFSIRLCSAMSAGQTIDFAVPADRHDGEQGKSADTACAFQSVGLAALGAVPGPVLLLHLRHVLAHGLAPTSPVRIARPAAPPPPATGPPAIR